MRCADRAAPNSTLRRSFGSNSRDGREPRARRTRQLLSAPASIHAAMSVICCAESAPICVPQLPPETLLIRTLAAELNGVTRFVGAQAPIEATPTRLLNA